MTDFAALAKQAKQTNPVAVSGRVGGVVPQTPKQQQEGQSDTQTFGTLSNILAVPNIPGGAAGAFLRDVAHGRRLGGDQPQGTPTAMSHFFEALPKGPAAAVNEYFATSPQSMKEYREGSNPTLRAIGGYFAKHPKQGAALDFVGRILDPGNAMTLDATQGLSAMTKGLVRSGARKAANAIIKHAPEAAASNTVRVLKSAEHQNIIPNRFAEIRSGAEDIARDKGWHEGQVSEHGAAAESAGRDIINADRYAKAAAQKAVNSIGKGLTKGEEFDLMNMIEGDSPLMGTTEKLDAKQLALRDKLMPRVTKYRELRARLDAGTTKFQVADKGRLLHGPTFFSRAGMYADPANELGEEALPQDEAFREHFGGGGGTGPKKGSLGENVHRKYPTHVAAMRAGVKLRPDVTPMKALEMHVYSRVKAQRINEQLDKLTDLGLIIPKNEPVPFAIGVTRPVPQPPGFTDFSQLGSMRTFGSDITRNAWVHPSVPSLIEDVAATQKTRNGVASLMHSVAGAGRVANHILSAAEVSDPAWHPLFNVDENIISEAPNPLKMIRGMSKQAIGEAEEQGVHVPFARRQNASDWSRPWSDLSPKEKFGRAMRAIPHGVESVSAKPLYGHAEPAMATAAFHGLIDKLGPSGAKLAVRSMLGEPEQLGAATNDAAQLLQFPGWSFSQMRRWPAMVAQRPALYNAPHAAARDINLSQGRGDRQGDEGKMIPPIVLGRDKNGDFNMLSIPHPGNRASELGTAILKGDKEGVQYAMFGAANPLLQGPLYDSLGSEQQKNLRDVAPAETPLEGVMSYLKGFGSFSPIRSLTHTELTPEHAKARAYLINSFLYDSPGRYHQPGLQTLRGWQRKAERAGNTGQADSYRKQADALYAQMQKAVTSQGFPSP